jgi:hypothetical protein
VRQLSDEQAVDPPERELDELDAMLVEVLVQSRCPQRRKAALSHPANELHHFLPRIKKILVNTSSF